jgi:hypothetical protein
MFFCELLVHFFLISEAFYYMIFLSPYTHLFKGILVASKILATVNRAVIIIHVHGFFLDSFLSFVRDWLWQEGREREGR